eukprot:791859-Pleurochrysis_carterae.AAC.1
MSNTVAPQLSLVPTASSTRWPRGDAKERDALGGNAAGCDFSQVRTGSNFDETGPPIDRAVGKHAK